MRRLVLAVFIGCGDHSKADPCATPGASYELHPVEQANGTCGPLPNVVVNINPDGTITSSANCQSSTVEGCTVHNTDCSTTINGVTCSATSDVTYSSDGSGASGVETLTCESSTSSCASTYDVTAVRL